MDVPEVAWKSVTSILMHVHFELDPSNSFNLLVQGVALQITSLQHAFRSADACTPKMTLNQIVHVFTVLPSPISQTVRDEIELIRFKLGSSHCIFSHQSAA